MLVNDKYIDFKGEYIFPLPDFNPENLTKLKLDENTNPYKGLASFEKEDQELFFGRKRLIEEPKEGLLAKVSDHPLTVVLGASGSGKSSLVKAGLIPTLNEKWQVLKPMRPGESPLQALNKILKPSESSSSLILSLTPQEKIEMISSKIAELMPRDSESKLLLVVDQSEELLTLCRNEQEREEFLNLLAELLAKYQQQLRIVLTLRSDFEPQLRDAIKSIHWQKAWQDGRFFVTPMNREELQQAIEEPAANRKLVEQEQVNSSTIRDVMLRMVAISGGELARRRLAISELVYPEPKNEQAQKLIDRFLEVRLLVKGLDTEGQEYVEPVHDALVTGWQKLLAWKQESEESLLLQRRLTPAAEEWESVKSKEQPSGFQAKAEPVINWLDSGLYTVENLFNKIPAQIARLWQRTRNQPERSREKPVQFLWNSNPYLDVLNETLNSNDNWLNQVEAEFVQQSVLQKRQNISWRWRIAGLVTLAISAAAIVAFVQWINTQKQLVSTISALANNSQELFESNKEFDALLTSINAGKQLKQVVFGANPDIKIRIKNALQDAVLWVKEQNRLEGHRASVRSASFSPDGKQLASGSSDNTIRIWDVATGQKINTLQGHPAGVNSISFSPDGKQLVYSSSDSFSIDNQLLAFATFYKITIWDLNTDQIKIIKTGNSFPNITSSISFSPNGKLLVSGSADDKVILWNWEILSKLTFDNLLERSCDWVRDYLENNPNVAESDRSLCDDIPSPEAANIEEETGLARQKQPE